MICEPIMFVIATVRAPFSRASFIASIVSRVSPDWEIPITSGVLVDHRVAVDPLGGDVRLDRNPRPLLDHVAADDAGVVRGAAGEDHDPAQPLLASEGPRPSRTSVPWRTRSPIVSATASDCS